MGIEDQVLAALRTDVHAMCVGPVTARPLVRLGVPTSAPERMRLGALARHITDEIVIATYSSAAEWNDLNPRVLNYLSVGAMGLASSHGLGLALANPNKRIVILDGDGSLLMNLGSLVTIGAQAPKNLVHFVSNNGCYEANGGHQIPNKQVDFSGIAKSTPYGRPPTCSSIQDSSTSRRSAL